MGWLVLQTSPERSSVRCWPSSSREFYTRAAKEAAHIIKGDADALGDQKRAVAIGRAEQAQHGPGILQRIHGLYGRDTGTLRPAIGPFGLAFLDVRAVAQHEITKGTGFARGIHVAAESLLVQRDKRPV